MPSIFYFPTAIVVGLLLSYLLTFLCHDKIRVYKNSLRTEQKVIYDRIVSRRRLYSVMGVIAGLFLSILYLVLFLRSTGLYQGVVNFLLIFLLTPMIVYSVLPKPVYMLETSTTPEQSKAWFDIYLCMKNAMIYGFFIGLVATLLLMGLVESLV